MKFFIVVFILKFTFWQTNKKVSPRGSPISLQIKVRWHIIWRPHYERGQGIFQTVLKDGRNIFPIWKDGWLKGVANVGKGSLQEVDFWYKFFSICFSKNLVWSFYDQNMCFSLLSGTVPDVQNLGNIIIHHHCHF